MYVLCPGPPLPKEIPGQHRRLAKRDTRVCEAHSKQERRALRRTVVANTAAAPVMMGSYGSAYGGAYPRSSYVPVPVGIAPVPLVAPLVAAVPVAGAAAVVNGGALNGANPTVIPVQLQAGNPPVLCSIAPRPETADGKGPAADASARTMRCSVPGCVRAAVDYHVGE